MNLENVLKTTGLIEKHNLTIRGPIDLINIPDTSKLDDSIWNKKQGILARKRVIKDFDQNLITKELLQFVNSNII